MTATKPPCPSCGFKAGHEKHCLRVTIETRHGGKRDVSVDFALAFLTKARNDGFEVVVNGELWTYFEGDGEPEYKVSPHADLNGGDYDKGCLFVNPELAEVGAVLEASR